VTAPEAALIGRDLTVGYVAGQPVLEHLDVIIPEGGSTVITGPNGVGKSALALTLAGLLPQLGGAVVASPNLVPGPANRRQRYRQPISDPHDWTSEQLLTRLGTVFQRPEHQFVTGSVRDELAAGLLAQRLPAPVIAARVGELLSLLQLEALADANPFTLSGGEKRRLSVGTVLASEPAVIILDEPTFGQDRVTWCAMVTLIRRLVDEGRTVVSVTHDQGFIEALGENRIDLGATPIPLLRRGGDEVDGVVVCHESQDHPVSPFGPATPPREGNYSLDRLNPAARLLNALLLAVPVLITLDWVSALVMLGLEVVAFALAGVRPKEMARRLWPVAIIAAIAALSMALYARPDGAVFWNWWVMAVSERSLLLALAIFARILALALAAIVLLGRIDPTLMADALAQLVRLPARFVLGTLAGVRMLGLMAADWQSLGLARRARGLGDAGAIRRVVSMAFALLVMSIRRGTKLATAMEVRGFNAQSARHRTWARPSILTAADAVGLVATLLVCGISLVAAVWAGTFWFIWTGGLT